MKTLAKWLAALTLLLVSAPAFAQTATPFGATAGSGLNFCAYKPDATNLAGCEVKYVWNGSAWVLEPADLGGHPYVSTFSGAQNISLNGGPYTLASAAAYGMGTALCNSATTATCNGSAGTGLTGVYFVLPTGNFAISGGVIRLNDSSAAWGANAQIVADLWSGIVTLTGGDGVAYKVATGTANYVGTLTCTTTNGAQGDGVIFNCAVVGGQKTVNLGSANAKLYATFYTPSGSGTPTAGSTLAMTLQGN